MKRTSPETGSALPPDLILGAYMGGVFPMAEDAAGEEIFWVDPRRRGLLPLGRFHISRSLRRTLRKQPFGVTFDRDFDGVLAGCADRPETWINTDIATCFTDLYARGAAHSVEVWRDGRLVGGVYGLGIGAAFFAESMFSRERDASKVALAYLMHRLLVCGYELCDTQFLTPHLATLGGIEVSREIFRALLARATAREATFRADLPLPDPDHLMQRITHIS